MLQNFEEFYKNVFTRNQDFWTNVRTKEEQLKKKDDLKIKRQIENDVEIYETLNNISIKHEQPVDICDRDLQNDEKITFDISDDDDDNLSIVSIVSSTNNISDLNSNGSPGSLKPIFDSRCALI